MDSASLGLGLIAIAHAVHGVDAVELRIDGLELFPNAFAVAVDRALADVVVVRISLARELAARLDVSRMAHERLQHHEFGHRQLDRLTFPADDESLRVELERSYAEKRVVITR